jgi:hypothetical protein
MHAIQVVKVECRDRREQHDRRGVDDDVEATESTLDRVERRGHGGLVRDVAADRYRVPASGGDVIDQAFGPSLVAAVVDTDRESIGGKAPNHGASNAAGAARDESDARSTTSHRDGSFRFRATRVPAVISPLYALAYQRYQTHGRGVAVIRSVPRPRARRARMTDLTAPVAR